MSWHDTTRIDESLEDRALRAELQTLLGLRPERPEQSCSAAPTAESINDTTALAQSLYREAMRRRRTAAKAKPMVKRPLFLLVAAAIPVFFTVTAIGAWGVKQKRRADALAARALELETRQNRIDAAREGVRNREEPLIQAAEPNQINSPGSRPDRGPNNQNNAGELIKPEERPRRLDNQADQHRVNDKR
ncbi:MAG: hypothetical protein LBQ86_05175 [Holophagales bacterium]|jgi:hypothetical protein|nr:hypothetical protein [Holophagales bacterium]